MSTSPRCALGDPRFSKRDVGSKATKMIYTGQTEVGQTTEFVAVDDADRRRLSLTDAEVTELARQALIIEDHYARPMDIEWGKDGLDGQLYVLQARPETVKSRQVAARIQRYRIRERGPVLAEGRAIGQKIGAGTARVLSSIADMQLFVPGGLGCRHDRSRLGADHEARISNRHQSWRPHLPRGDHRA
jgi:pyruvate,water dikinase